MRSGDDLLTLLRNAVSFEGHEVQRAITRMGDLILRQMLDRDIAMQRTIMTAESSFKSEMRTMRDQIAAMERKLGAATPMNPQPRPEVRP